MDISHLYRITRSHVTLNNSVLVVALLIVLGSIWNTVMTLQKNFILQQKVDLLEQQIKVAKLEVETLQLQQQYLGSREYQELVAREKLGKAAPGEKVINLPALPEDPQKKVVTSMTQPELSNFQKWMQFFFGR
jgi:cell division protein FtsB